MSKMKKRLINNNNTNNDLNSDSDFKPLSDFYWAGPYQTHARRRRAILKKYPQIRQLMHHDQKFKWHCLAVVTIQLVSFFIISYILLDGFSLMSNRYYYNNNLHWSLRTFGLFLFGFLVTCPLNHMLVIAIHDIAHNQAFGSDHFLANRLFGMVVSLPTTLPISFGFYKYHKDHHAYLGRVADTDLPFEWEGRLINTPLRKVLHLIIYPMMFAIRPSLISPKPTHWLDVFTFAVQIGFDYLLYQCMGATMTIYIFFCTGLVGIHPIGTHVLTEHFVFFRKEVKFFVLFCF